MQLLDGGWVRQGNIVAFPQGWQLPAKTEEWIYETLIRENCNSLFVEYVAFPWATLIDLIKRKKNDKVNFYVAALKSAPPKKNLIRLTSCQHVEFKSIIDYFRELGISDLFASHKEVGSNAIHNIRLHPLALYPVSFFNDIDCGFRDLNKRKYLYSFIGAYDQGCYISDVRDKILSGSKSSDCLIIKRNNWHFELDVYKQQIDGLDLSLDEINCIKRDAIEYKRAISDSIFSLCPSGSGPNSIRFWESIALGAIPILLSDRLDVPQLSSSIKYLRYAENEYPRFLASLPNIELKELKFQFSKENVSSLFLENIISFFSDKKKLINMHKLYSK